MNGDELREILPPVDRLNSWVRSKSYALGGSGRHVIYHYKGEVIKAAARAGLVEYLPVWVMVRCRDCNGTKRYTDWSGYAHDHCWRCSSKGHTRLDFVETRIDTFRWHTPRVRAWDFPGLSRDAVAKEARDWAVNEGGRDLPLDDALVGLMKLEEALQRPARRWAGDDYSGGYWDDFANYRVDVGRSDEGVCVVCSSRTDRMGWHGASRGRISWSAKVCVACDTRDGTIWDRLREIGPPPALITPTVARWIETHPAPPEKRSLYTG